MTAMARRFVTLDVFTDRALAGIPLAVVLDSEGLDGNQMQAIARVLPAPEQAGCVLFTWLSRSQIVALQAQGGWQLHPMHDTGASSCQWLVLPLEMQRATEAMGLTDEWDKRAVVPRPTDKNAEIVIYQRKQH